MKAEIRYYATVFYTAANMKGNRRSLRSDQETIPAIRITPNLWFGGLRARKRIKRHYFFPAMDTREFPVLSDEGLVKRLAIGLGDDAARVLAYLLRRRETDRFGRQAKASPPSV